MRLRNAVFAGEIARLALDWPDLAFAPDSAPDLLLYFRTGAPLERIGATKRG